MSFPENKDKPSRTVTATNIGTSREALIYKSEYNRTGHGEYRIPTVREMACLMCFPITYQFLGGSEYSKCRLVGNAVSPSVSRALAVSLKKKLKLKVRSTLDIQKEANLKGVINLNVFNAKEFNNPPIKNKGARFRRHPFKYGNITVTLSNYDILLGKSDGKWITSVQYGNGDGFPSENYADDFHMAIEPIIKQLSKGNEFVQQINNGFASRIPQGAILQELYETQSSQDKYLEPTDLVDQVGEIIENLKINKKEYEQTDLKFFKYKKVVPLNQLYALYAINKISYVANQ